MAKVSVARLTILGAAMLLAGAAPAQPVLGPDAAACAAGRTALLVRVSGFKDREGILRVSTYAATEAEWLVKRRYLHRYDITVPAAGAAQVCVGLAKPGSYGVAVLHDRNGNGKANIFSDGGGFSNNPKLGLSKPKVDAVAIAAGTGVTTIDIALRYL